MIAQDKKDRILGLFCCLTVGLLDNMRRLWGKSCYFLSNLWITLCENGIKDDFLAYNCLMIRVFSSKTQQLGKEGEDIAASHLTQNGYKVLDRNVHLGRGEIDIIAKKNSTIHFFEVKARKKGGFINPAENLSRDKLRKFVGACEYYALTHGIRSYYAKAIVVLLGNGNPSIELFDIE